MFKHSRWLLQHQRSFTSQFGEDGILEKIFEILPNSDKWCVEFGAADGMTLSNTYNLIHHHGWSSIQIEADPNPFAILANRYQENPSVICINKTIDFEGENRLDEIFKETPIPSDFDLICIDVDGVDYFIWESIQDYRPKVVMIEFNPTIPHYVPYTQAKDMSINHGSSLLALMMLGKKKGYELICSTEINAIFVDNQYYPLFEIFDNSIWKMNDNYDYWTYIFQGYDGTIFLSGNSRMIWHGFEVDFDQLKEIIQVLTPEERGYKGL